MKRKNRLQVLFDEKNPNCEWEYVFCYDQWSQIVTTKDYRKALKGYDLDFFQNKYGNYHFRVV